MKIEHDTGKNDCSSPDLSGTWVRTLDYVSIVIRDNVVVSETPTFNLLSGNKEISYKGYKLVNVDGNVAHWINDEYQNVFWIRHDGTSASKLLTALYSGNPEMHVMAQKILCAQEKLQGQFDSLSNRSDIVQMDVLKTMTALTVVKDQIVGCMDQVCSTQQQQAQLLKDSMEDHRTVRDVVTKMYNIETRLDELAQSPTAIRKPEATTPPVRVDKIGTNADRRESQYFSPNSDVSGDKPEDNDAPADNANVSRASSASSPTKKQETTVPVTIDVIDKQLRALGSMKFIELADQDFLRHHITRTEKLLKSYQLMANGAIPDHLQDDLCSRFIESLKSIHRFYHPSLTHIRERGANWNVLKVMLISRFCSRDQMIASYRRRLDALQFTSVFRVHEFTSDAITIHSLLQQANGGDCRPELRMLVKQIIDKLPGDSMRWQVTNRVMQCRRGDADWETCIPFAPDYATANTTTGVSEVGGDYDEATICGIIEEVCLVFKNSYNPADRKNKYADARQPHDKVQAMTNLNRYVMFIRSSSTKIDTVVEKLTAAGYTNVVGKTNARGRKIANFESDLPLNEISTTLRNVLEDVLFDVHDDRPKNM